MSSRVADELGCVNRAKAATYSRGGGGFVGRQREAPLDCYASEGQYRIIVPDGEEAAQAVVAYYPRVWLVVGPDWVITANDERAARSAHARLGGTLRPPPGGCCGPPTSDRVPGLGG